VSQPYIGVGHSPDGVDLPLGLGMKLAQEPRAMDAFGRLTTEQKSRLIEKIQSAHTGQEAQEKIDHAVSSLSNGGFGL